LNNKLELNRDGSCSKAVAVLAVSLHLSQLYLMWYNIFQLLVEYRDVKIEKKQYVSKQ